MEPETVTIKATAAAILIQICIFLYTSRLRQCHWGEMDITAFASPISEDEQITAGFNRPAYKNP